MYEITTLMAALFGTLGFGLIFKTKPSALVACTFGGATAWGVVLISTRFGAETFTSNLFAAIFSMIFASFVSKKMKLPSTVLITPCMIPLVPGGGLYYTMQGLISRDFEAFKSYGTNTLLTVFGIAGGIIVGSIVFSAFHTPKISKIKNINRLITREKHENDS